MVNEGKRKQLGRGLSALLGDDNMDVPDADQRRMIRVLPIEFLHPGKFQPRQHIDEERLEELAQSIREKGILQPLLVRRLADQDNAFEIIAGERRWRAAQRAKVHEVPVIVKELDDREALEIGLIENLQRQDLSPLEEADGYRRLMEEFTHTQQELSEVVGKSRSHVANMMRLLSLPAPIKELVASGSLSAGHARALLNAPAAIELAERVVRQNLNVRQTEKLVQSSIGRGPRKARAPQVKDADTLALERDLTDRLGLKVDIRYLGGGGTVTIAYETLEQLDEVLRLLSQDEPHAAADVSEPVVLGVRPALDEDPLSSWEAEAGRRPQAEGGGAGGGRQALDAAIEAFDQAAEAFAVPAAAGEDELDAVVRAAEGPGPAAEPETVFDTRSLDAVLQAAERRDEGTASSVQAADLDDSFDLEEDGAAAAPGPGTGADAAGEQRPRDSAESAKPIPSSSRGLERELSDE